MAEENTLFPGRPNYTGPTKGYFAFLHHTVLFEKSHDVMERVDYVQRKKAANEVETRLHNMIYLPFMTGTLDADYRTKVATLYADYWAKCAPLYADYNAKRDTLDADYNAKRDTLDADYEAKRAPLYADYEAKRDTLDADILTFIRQHIPDCAWNGRELVFPEVAKAL